MLCDRLSVVTMSEAGRTPTDCSRSPENVLYQTPEKVPEAERALGCHTQLLWAVPWTTRHLLLTQVALKRTKNPPKQPTNRKPNPNNLENNDFLRKTVNFLKSVLHFPSSCS